MKKITKFLDSVMGGIKRTCIAKALAVFAVASIAINANADEAVDAQGVITGIDKLVGKTQDELYAKKIDFSSDENLTFPTDDFTKQFFLYNVKTGRLLNAGGYWGTHVALKEYGKPLAIVSASQNSTIYMKLVMEMNGTEGKFVGWVGVPGASGKNPADIGTYVDRKSTDVIGWQLEPLNDDKNTYRLYTYAHSKFDENGVKWNTNKKFYLASNKGVVDADRNCEAYAEDSIANYEGYDQWRFLSYEQIIKQQKENADNLTDALELSFMLKCPGFSRGDNDIKSWNTYNYDLIGKTTGIIIHKPVDPKNNKSYEFARYGLQYYYNNKIAGPNTTNEFTAKSLPSGGYTFNGSTYTTIGDDYERNLGKYYCASITNKRGVIYQDIDVTLSGTFKIECKGYSTTKKAALFAGVLDPNDQKKEKMLNGALNKTILNQTSDMQQTVQDELHISENNIDYAGKSFYSGNYNNVVYVTVPEDAPKNSNGKYTIRVGIMIGDNVDDKKPGTKEWTVFDDFRMLYASRTYNEDLILDEERDNLTYLTKLKPVKNKTMRLRKTFTVNKWNSFILPVNLTKKQVTETFGTDTRLAKLTGLTETGIEFTSVPLSGDNDLALEAYVPYLIFPTKAADQTPAYTAKYEQNGIDTRLQVTIGANHYVTDKVSMPLTAEGNNDFLEMDQDNWTSKTTNGSTDIVAYGTFARTFDPDATQNPDNGEWTYSSKKGTIITGRDDLKGCYFFDKGNMYHSKNDNTYRPRGLRGFSCWFKPVNGKSQNVSLTLDGVSQGTTGIEDILADYEQPVSRYANGIYNLNGQLVKQGNSTAGLPSGLYIVNGKKCIVR